MAHNLDKIQIEFLDHVALRVANIDVAAAWYQKVLDFKKLRFPAWGEIPVFMMSNACGIALFPANLKDEELSASSKNVKIDHFAFNVTQSNFDKAKKRYETLQLDYHLRDHHYFHSIYTKDPDGHTVELTTLVVDKNKVDALTED